MALLTKGLGLQNGNTSVPGLTRIIIMPWQDFTYTAGTDGAIATIAAATASTAYEFLLPDNAGSYQIGFAGQGLQEYSITVNLSKEGNNVEITSSYKELEGCPKLFILAQSKKAGADNSYRILGRYNGVRATAGDENTNVSGTAPSNTLTFTGTEPIKPEYLELTAEQSITDALTQITIA